MVMNKGAPMKIDRLIGILSVLLQEEKVTAPQLAEKFEVSRRTINRDIEDLCRAGIPVVTLQGAGGGISIMNGYRMDRTLLTSKEMQVILAGLRSLDSISGSSYCSRLMEKLKTGSSDFVSGRDWMLIDLSSWDKSSLAPKIEKIQTAIEKRNLLGFSYFSPKGESLRKIEPYYLIFKWTSWYVWGWCSIREDFRLFKLNRMTELQISEEKYEPRPVPLPDLSTERIFSGEGRIEAIFQPDMRWRLVEEFGPESFETLPEGKLFFSADYSDDENLLSWLLTFCDKVEVLSPSSLREKMKDSITKMEEVYG